MTDDTDSVEEIHIYLDPKGDHFYTDDDPPDPDEELQLSVATPEQMNTIHAAIMVALQQIQDDE